MTVTRRHELLGLIAILALAMVVLARQIGVASAEFDEQVYLASADTLTRGFELGRDVFTSQPPLFLSALGQADSAVGGNATMLRILLVLTTLAGAAAAWAIVRSRAGAVAGLLTALLVALAPGVVEAAAVVSADVPSVALGTLALLAANAACSRPRWALAAGILISCALLTKFLAAPFVLAIAATALVRHPRRVAYAWFGAGILVVAGVGLAVYADALGPLFNGAVTLHLEARNTTVDLPRPDILVAVILCVSAYLGLFLILASGLLGLQRHELRDWLRQRADLLVLFGAGFALCAIQRPLLNHHLVIVAWPLALLAGSALPRRPWDSRWSLGLVAVGLALILPWAAHGRDTIDDDGQRSLDSVAQVVAQSTAVDAEVVSDIPAVPVLAGRSASPWTVDPSYVRVQTGELSLSEIMAAANRADAAVIGRAFRQVPGLDAALHRRFSRTVTYQGVAVWTQPRARWSQSRHQLIAIGSQEYADLQG